MDRFHEMQVFLAVAEEEGFAAAARRLVRRQPAHPTVLGRQGRLAVGDCPRNLLTRGEHFTECPVHHRLARVPRRHPANLRLVLHDVVVQQVQHLPRGPLSHGPVGSGNRGGWRTSARS